MGKKPFTVVAAILLLAVAVAHVFRLVDGWQVTVGDSHIPLWASWVGLVVAGGLSLMLFREARR